MIGKVIASKTGAGDVAVRSSDGPMSSEFASEWRQDVREGIRRRYLLYDGTRVDSTLFSRLADDA